MITAQDHDSQPNRCVCHQSPALGQNAFYGTVFQTFRNPRARTAAREDLVYRYVDDDGISAASLEWCLANALLRQDTVTLGRMPTRLLPKLRATGSLDFAAANALVFWMVFLALNLLRWFSPTMSPALAKKSSRSTLLTEMRALHDKLLATEFDAAQLLRALQALVARGAPVQPVWLRLAEKSARRQDFQMRPA